METKLEDLANIVSGQSPKSEFYSKSEGIPFLQGNRTFGVLYPAIDTFTSNVTKLAKKNSILMSVRAPVGDLNFANRDICIGRGLASIESKDGNNIFLFYALKFNMPNLIKQGAATTYDAVNSDLLKEFVLTIPDQAETRSKVGELLFSIDSQIELNSRIMSKLHEYLEFLYQRILFLNDDSNRECGSPKNLPEVWEKKLLSDILEVKTGKRDANFADTEGNYKFFTCSEEILRCASFAFEGSAVLLAGNGNFNIKIYEGRFDAYQRTYVLMPIDKRLIPLVYLAVKDRITSLATGSRGSIVKFITKGDIEDINIWIPSDLESKELSHFNDLVRQIQLLTDENNYLEDVKNWLLPSLFLSRISINLSKSS